MIVIQRKKYEKTKDFLSRISITREKLFNKYGKTNEKWERGLIGNTGTKGIVRVIFEESVQHDS